MSEGPIKRERAAWEPKRVTTKPRDSVHALGPQRLRTMCGRRTDTSSLGTVAAVTCSDCQAALRADGLLS